MHQLAVCDVKVAAWPLSSRLFYCLSTYCFGLFPLVSLPKSTPPNKCHCCSVSAGCINNYLQHTGKVLCLQLVPQKLTYITLKPLSHKLQAIPIESDQEIVPHLFVHTCSTMQEMVHVRPVYTCLKYSDVKYYSGKVRRLGRTLWLLCNDDCYCIDTNTTVFGSSHNIHKKVESNIQAGREEAATINEDPTVERKLQCFGCRKVAQERESGNILGRCFAELWKLAV